MVSELCDHLVGIVQFCDHVEESSFNFGHDEVLGLCVHLLLLAISCKQVFLQGAFTSLLHELELYEDVPLLIFHACSLAIQVGILEILMLSMVDISSTYLSLFINVLKCPLLCAVQSASK